MRTSDVLFPSLVNLEGLVWDITSLPQEAILGMILDLIDEGLNEWKDVEAVYDYCHNLLVSAGQIDD